MRKEFQYELICSQCARDRDGVLFLTDTKIHDVCEYCNGSLQEPEETLRYWYDYNWPYDKKAQYVALQMR